jgi:6-phosphogluconolactonase
MFRLIGFTIFMQLYKPFIAQYEKTDLLYQDAQNIIVDRVNEAAAQTGLARIALSGGQTPFPLYERLSLDPSIDWSTIELYQTDERYVNKSDQNSNQNQISKAIGIDGLRELRSKNFFNVEYPLELAASDYSDIIDSLDGVLFDVTVLGVGSDGHFASLFPGGEYLKHNEAKAIFTKAPKYLEVKDRLSLTLESILSSDLIVVLLTGEKKKNVVTEILEGKLPASEFPAKFLLAHPNLHIFQSFEE